MKKVLSVTAVAILCVMISIAMTACGTTAVKGSTATFTDQDCTFAIDLPSLRGSFWIQDQDTSGDIIDITDESDTINIYVQRASKDQLKNYIKDLATYEDYSLMSELSDVLNHAEMNETQLNVPDFITGSRSYDLSLPENATGFIVFMESEKYYYTYVLIADNDVLLKNKAILTDSLMSLQEISPVESE